MNETQGTTRRDEERRYEMKQKIEKERAQMSGTQTPVQFMQQRPKRHDAVHLSRPDHHCSGSFRMAVNALKNKAQRALYGIKKKNPKILNYRSEV